MLSENSILSRIAASKRCIILFLLTLFMYVSCGSPDEDPIPNNNQNNDQMTDDEVGEAAPDFELMALDGSTIKLSDYENKVVVLFFLGNNCPYCKAVAPDVEKDLHADYAGKTDYVILGLDTWDGNSSSLKSFKDNTGVTFPLLLEASGVANDYGTTYDRLVVIDKQGKIAHNGTRATTNDLSTVKSKVDDLLDNM